MAATSPDPAPRDAAEAAAGDGVEIRHLRTQQELAACLALQAATWGDGFREAVPATILRISQRLGGVAAGAFAPDGALLGFVFGMTGVERGAIVHWSDMLAVRADHHNHGIGRRLKEFQRDAVRAVGATRMYWTYDPLLARNAHFNLTRLGARVVEFVPDMYGADTGSALHGDSGTDRFVVAWPLDDADRVRGPAAPTGDARTAPILNDGVADGRDADPSRVAAALPPYLRVEIPADILAEQVESPTRAARWRAGGRRALEWALAHGYAVDRFDHDAATRRGFYLLTRATTT